MKRLFLIVWTAGMLLSTAALSQLTWQVTSGPEGGNIRALAVNSKAHSSPEQWGADSFDRRTMEPRGSRSIRICRIHSPISLLTALRSVKPAIFLQALEIRG